MVVRWCPELETLNLCGTRIVSCRVLIVSCLEIVVSCLEIVPVLVLCRTLTELDVVNCLMQGQTRNLTPALRTWTALTTLDVIDNGIQFTTNLHWITDNLSWLNHLNLTWNQLDESVTPLIVATVPLYLRLKNLDLSNNFLRKTRSRCLLLRSRSAVYSIIWTCASTRSIRSPLMCCRRR